MRPEQLLHHHPIDTMIEKKQESKCATRDLLTALQGRSILSWRSGPGIQPEELQGSPKTVLQRRRLCKAAVAAKFVLVA